MKLFIGLDPGKLEAQKRALQGVLEKRLDAARAILRDALTETGGEVAEALSARTFPSEMAIGIAVKAMRFDLSLVYCTEGRAFEILKGSAGLGVANRFYGAFKRGDLSAAAHIVRTTGSPIASIIIGQALRPELRESVRDKDGRVVCAYPLQLVTAAELSAHAKLAIMEIGKTSAGWSACAEQLGGDGNAIKWKGTAQHGSGGGHVEWQEDEFGVHLKLENEMPLARKHISPGQVDAIMRPARERLLKRLEPIAKSSAA
ncbi:MAG: hypothetical protein ABIT37_01650 [Luteolibacter sp.]